LATRDLVLVTVENEILNVLTGEQQLQVQRQIAGAIADYWRQRKSQALMGRAEINTFLPLPKEKAHLLPPVRAFRRVMAWVQLSPVAIAANLFQESRLSVVHIATEPHAPSPAKPSVARKPWLSMEEFFAGEFLGVTGTGQIVRRSDESLVAPDRPEDFDPGGNLQVPASAAIDQPVAQVGAIDPPLLEAETWEAEVTGVSYEQHPLERLLKWLDSGMLWIEQKLGEVLNWMNREN
jgi:hypothetical protein